MQQRYLFTFDFDNTIAATSEPNADGVSVEVAYERAIGDMLGEIGVERYLAAGGLQNRAPGELMSLVADDKNADVSGLTEELIQRKLGYLRSLINENWPPACEGFVPFWESLQRSRSHGLPIDTALISAGHEEFIAKVFQVWGLPQPDIMVTDDDIRGRSQPKEAERRYKPGQLQLAIAHQRWLRMQGVVGFDMLRAQETKERIIHFGDHEKDREMAQRGRIAFGFFNPSDRSDIDGSFTFTNWRAATNVIEINSKLFREGAPVRELFVPALRVENFYSRAGERK